MTESEQVRVLREALEEARSHVERTISNQHIAAITRALAVHCLDRINRVLAATGGER